MQDNLNGLMEVNDSSATQLVADILEDVDGK